MSPASSRSALTLVAALLCAAVAMRSGTAHAAARAPTDGAAFESVCGDPGMSQPEPRVLLEGWNFCNRCGRACTVAPRWADCIGPDGTQLVSAAANAAGLPMPKQNQSMCDSYTEQKERDLGALCQRQNALGQQTYFWTAMLKSGAMNVSERGRLCGLWCEHKDPPCNPGDRVSQGAGGVVMPWDLSAEAQRLADDDYIMRQPIVVHDWSTPYSSGDVVTTAGTAGYHGSFYGTYDLSVDPKDLPTPDDVIRHALTPPSPAGDCSTATCNLRGTWLGGNGDSSLPIVVSQNPGKAGFSASCAWAPGGGRPAPWLNQTGTVASDAAVLIHLEGHTDTGVSLLVGDNTTAPQLICWSATSYWCRGAGCSGASATCAAHPGPANVSSYFGLEWVVRDGKRIFRNVLRTGHDLSWIMLYTGPEAATGGKGGYPWDGRGQYAPVPQSTTLNASTWPASAGKMPTNNFKVTFWTNITAWPGGPGFYFLNHGACWKDDGSQCDGDLGTDVTRYLLFQLPSPSASADDPDRCGPRPEQRGHCPAFHRYRNGTTVLLGDPLFPYRAYHSVPQRGANNGGFKCKHDCWSNPCDQDWVRIEPSPEWAEYGYPETVEEAMTPHAWEMDVGAVTAQMSTHFSGTPPPRLFWSTLNVGPEMSAPPGSVAVWELADMDVLIESGSQELS